MNFVVFPSSTSNLRNRRGSGPEQRVHLYDWRRSRSLGVSVAITFGEALVLELRRRPGFFVET